MTWRVLIVDDEPAGRDRLIDLCKDVADLELVGVCEDAADARALLKSREIDLVFLDVQMAGGDGFDALEGLEPERRPAVIFSTAHPRFAVRAFDTGAIDYLLKPFGAARFRAAVDRATEYLRRRRERDFTSRIGELLAERQNGGPNGHATRLPVRSAGRVSFLKLDDIEWLDAAGDAVRVHAHSGDQTQVHRVRDTMAAVERQLDPARFARIHRSTIVNLDRVREVLVSAHGDYVVVTDRGQRLTVGRLYRDRIQSLLRGAAAS